MYRILVCDDEADILSALKIYLSTEEYQVFTAADGNEALSCLKQNEIHLVLLDVMMPGMDGITVLSHIRSFSNIPVILLTAKSEDSDKIQGLDAGADDYVTKPFSPVELLARVRSQLRRYTRLGGSSSCDAGGRLQVGGVALDPRERSVSVDGEPVVLTNTEFEILKLLMQNPGRVFSTKEIYRTVWKGEPIGEENIIAVHIRHIREKIEINPAEPRYLKVVWAQGYQMDGGRKP